MKDTMWVLDINNSLVLQWGRLPYSTDTQVRIINFNLSYTTFYVVILQGIEVTNFGYMKMNHNTLSSFTAQARYVDKLDITSFDWLSVGV